MLLPLGCLTQPGCHNPLKSLNSFPVSLLEAKAAQRARHPKVSTPSLLNLGYDLLRFADERISTENPYTSPILWRDGFMIALLALRPLRICNFVNLRLQNNLLIYHDIAWFRFQRYETKNGQYLELPYPKELISQLRRYIREVRPIFMRGTVSPYPWLSRRGQPMQEAVLRRIIKTRTSNIWICPFAAQISSCSRDVSCNHASGVD